MLNKSYILLANIILIFSVNSNAHSKTTRATKASILKAPTIIPSEPGYVEDEDEIIFAELDCLDKYCLSDFQPQKKACRCSSSIGKYNAIEQKIKEIQEEIEERNRITSLNQLDINEATNTKVAKITNKTDDIYKSLKTTDRVNSAGGLLSSLKEGSILYEAALKKCEIDTNDEDNEELLRKYENAINADCQSYSEQLNTRLEMATSSLAKAITNQETQEKLRFQRDNQLGKQACKTEYKSCLKLSCSLGFLDCSSSLKLENAILECEEKLYGKCENDKEEILEEIRLEVPKERTAERKRQKDLEKQKTSNRGLKTKKRKKNKSKSDDDWMDF